MDDSAQLKDDDTNVRRVVINILGQNSSLPNDILETLVSQLDDGDIDVRRAVIQTLGQQSSLPDNIFQALVSRLDDDYRIGFQVERVLTKHDNFYSMFPCLHTQSLLALYRIWVIEAFMEQFSCYMQDRILYIDAPDRRRQIPLLLQQGDVFKEFLTAATEIGSPRLCTDKYLEV